MTAQPTPKVTNTDVERIVSRDFSAERVVDVLAMLNEYGAESWQREAYRVRLATLKLAAGNFDRLRELIEAAKTDYRDVLAAAEYPGYGRGSMTPDEKQKAIDADWAQYHAWLTR